MTPETIEVLLGVYFFVAFFVGWFAADDYSWARNDHGSKMWAVALTWGFLYPVLIPLSLLRKFVVGIGLWKKG